MKKAGNEILKSVLPQYKIQSNEGMNHAVYIIDYFMLRLEITFYF